MATQTKTRTFDGNFSKLAVWVEDNISRAHRGVFVEHGKLIVFENRSHGGDKAVRQINLLCSQLEQKGCVIEGLSCGHGDEKSETWVLVALPPASSEAIVDVQQELGDLVWRVWRKVVVTKKDDSYDAYRACQWQIALEGILDRPSLPKSLLKAKRAPVTGSVPQLSEKQKQRIAEAAEVLNDLIDKFNSAMEEADCTFEGLQQELKDAGIVLNDDVIAELGLDVGLDPFAVLTEVPDNLLELVEKHLAKKLAA